MGKKGLVFIVFVFTVFSVYSQKHTISGYVEDKETGERLIGASVYNELNPSAGTSTNYYGFFSLTLPTGNYNLMMTYVGYTPQKHEIVLQRDTALNISLDSHIFLDEVTISGKRDIVEDAQMSRIDIPIKMIKDLPSFMGETDVLKAIQLLPGVQAGREGMSGIYVRGGGPDQNLILLDGVPVYNVNHLFGFFSVFNGDAISNVSLIKGGFPARYGGRLSSVLDVRMKEGNMYEYKPDIAIGLIASRATIEGPIVKGKSSFIVSARRTYLDIIAIPFEWLYASLDGGTDRFTAGYFFHDFNAKLNYRFSGKDRIYLSFYGGKDKVYANFRNKSMRSDKDKFNLSWGNFITSFRWNHIFTPKLFANTSFTFTKFNYFIGQEQSYSSNINGDYVSWLNKSAYSNGIYDLALNTDFEWSPLVWAKIRFGAVGIRHSFNPGFSTNTNWHSPSQTDTAFNYTKVFANEFAAYSEIEIKAGKRVNFNIGGRFAAYQIRDSLFVSPEPRLSASVLLAKNLSFKMAYSKMQQNIHLLANSTLGLPTDIWVPATDKILPQYSTQYAAGFAIKPYKNCEVTIEGFYKKMDNLVEYKDGQSLFFDFNNTSADGVEKWEDKVEQGKGWAYGIELYTNMNFGKLSAWAGYTLSWNNRQFESLSNGLVFPYKYDRRHDISIAATYKLNEKIDFGLTWVFCNGDNISLSHNQYLTADGISSYVGSLENENNPGNIMTNYYGHRNNYQLPAYHRLDLGVNLHKEKKRGTRTWSFSLYNAYCRQNPLFIDIYYDTEAQKTKFYQISLFPIIPSFSYIFKFK